MFQEQNQKRIAIILQNLFYFRYKSDLRAADVISVCFASRRLLLKDAVPICKMGAASIKKCYKSQTLVEEVRSDMYKIQLLFESLHGDIETKEDRIRKRIEKRRQQKLKAIEESPTSDREDRGGTYFGNLPGVPSN